MATPTTQTNKQYSLNYRDLLRGLLIAVLTAVITFVYEIISQKGFENIEWKEVLSIALAAGLSYLIKNWFTANEIVLVNPPADALNAIQAGANVKVGSTTITNTKPSDNTPVAN